MFLQSYKFWIFWRWSWKPETIIKQQTSAEQRVISPSAFYFYLFLIGIWASIAETPLASWSKKVTHTWVIPLKEVLKQFCSSWGFLVFVKYFFFWKREGRGVVLSWCTNWMLLETREIEKTECYLIGVNSNFQAIKLNTAGSACSISSSEVVVYGQLLFGVCCGMYSASVFVPLLSELSHIFRYLCLEAPSCPCAEDKA